MSKIYFVGAPILPIAVAFGISEKAFNGRYIDCIFRYVSLRSFFIGRRWLLSAFRVIFAVVLVTFS